jgi:hypothetical protein
VVVSRVRRAMSVGSPARSAPGADAPERHEFGVCSGLTGHRARCSSATAASAGSQRLSTSPTPRRRAVSGSPLRSVAPSLPTRTRTRVVVIGGAHGGRGRPTGIALAALSLALAQPAAPDLWFSPGPQDSGKERVI